MKFLKPFIALFTVLVFISCNTKNRPNIKDTVPGTPTYSDSVLTNHHGNQEHEATEKRDLKHPEYNR